MIARTKPASPKTGGRPAKTTRTYRGVRLQVTVGRSRFSIQQIKQAVEAAVVKNADALAGRT